MTQQTINVGATVGDVSADPIIVLDGVKQVLKTYKRGTSTELIPSKDAYKPDGTLLTNPITEQLAGYRQP